ncbi:MAG TPA: hypothetical protein VIS74_06870, partial [Chthoniobacterales bacterium]
MDGNALISNGFFYAGIGLFLGFLLRSRRFREVNILSATAESLALIRIVVSLVMLGYVIGENYPSIALIPREYLAPQGVIRWLFHAPFFREWHADPIFLQALTGVTVFFLVAA